ncbi:hypothetical protein [Oceanobacter mangrovi]|uniref:hypothetical protein n=1 Tax=Oceanobacter mangrovi TaxID=2862510 RepID=UPI001C8D387F|nr:hypothetical protein [Oceanobacter mangrovi]
MGIRLPAIDQTLTGKYLSEIWLNFESEIITVRELIKQRVAVEFSKRSETPAVFVPDVNEAAHNGEETSGTRLEQFQNDALSAFKNNGFFLLFDDRQLTELGEEICITQDSRIMFVQVVPLIGG